MSKKAFRSKASSSRAAATGGFGGSAGFGGFGSISASSTLSYLTEPPNLAAISNPNVVVSFKNLGKKDSSTKKRALEDLRSFIRSQSPASDAGIEEAVLEAWTQLYPRISIDNDRSVREMSHEIQSDLVKTVQKRITKYLPRLVGTWFGALNDRDRTVARKAQDGVKSLLDSEDKYRAFLKRFQAQILDYAATALKETSETLSDERNTSPDAMQEKYHRVLFSGISLVTTLLMNLEPDDIKNCQGKYEEIVSEDGNVWGLITSDDADVRISTCNLLRACMQTQKDLLERKLSVILPTLIMKGLRCSQDKSARHLLDILAQLEENFKEASTWNSPKSITALRKFVEQGSQHSGVEYWKSLENLIDKIPLDALLEDTMPAKFLSSFRKGINHRTELKSYNSQAWASYLHIVEVIARQSDQAHKSPKSSALLRETLYPLFEQYIHPTEDKQIWSAPDEEPATTVARAYLLATSIAREGFAEASSQQFQDEWSQLVEHLVVRLRSTLPAQSKDYEKSQAVMGSEVERYYTLLRTVVKLAHKSDSEESSSKNASKIIMDGSLEILRNSTALLVSREGKPFSAAVAVRETMKGVYGSTDSHTSVALQSPTALELVESFLTEHLPKLISSASGWRLSQCLRAFFAIPTKEPFAENLWSACTDAVLKASNDEESKFSTLRLLVPGRCDDEFPTTQPVYKLARAHPGLQKFYFEALNKTFELAPDSDVDFISALDSATAKSLVSVALKSLNRHDLQSNATVRALQKLLAVDGVLPMADDQTKETLSSLLHALQHATDSELRKETKKLLLEISKPNYALLAETYQSVLLGSDPKQQLGVKTLIEPVVDIIRMAPESLNSFLPQLVDWQHCLNSLINKATIDTIGCSWTMSGAFWLAESLSDDPSWPDDIVAMSAVFRMALYTFRILSEAMKIGNSNTDTHQDHAYAVFLSAALAQDIVSTTPIHVSQDKRFRHLREPVSNAEDFLNVFDMESDTAFGIDQVQSWTSVPEELRSTVENESWAPCSEASLYPALIRRCLETKGFSKYSFYSSRVLASIIERITNIHGSIGYAGDAWLSTVQLGFSGRQERAKAIDSFFPMLAVLEGLSQNGRYLRDSSLTKALLNQIISEISSASVNDDVKSRQTMILLVTLNACLDAYDNRPLTSNEIVNYKHVSGVFPIHNVRSLIFAVKQIISWTEDAEFRLKPHAAESSRVLRRLLPEMKEVYGSYWESTVSFGLSILSISKGEVLAVLENHASQRWLGLSPEPWNGLFPFLLGPVQIFRELRSLEEPNDDLEDALITHEKDISQALIALLELPRSTALSLNLLDAELAEALPLVKLEHIGDLADLYHYVSADNEEVQKLAFDLIHRVLPSLQEGISVDVLLEKKDAQLPDELLSLILEAPPVDCFSLGDYSLTSPAQAYLLSWHLIFDCFQKASFKVRTDYIENLKSGDYMTPLLTFISNYLDFHATSPPVYNKPTPGASQIQHYDRSVGKGMTKEQNTEWLITSLYQLCLQYTPSLLKSWFIDCKSKQVKLSIQAWTEKYFSPIVVENTLNEVKTWTDAQEPSDDEKPLLVKTSKNGREVLAGYEVDESLIQIAIKLPATYPLENVKVEGINRVAVSEQQFKHWQINALGVITFSNGSVTDGLDSFRKNVAGHLKGVAECAICYSVVSADRKLPDKRCATCNNLFHGDCLYKWFHKSNQSSCPLCRNPFNYATRGMTARAAQAGGM